MTSSKHIPDTKSLAQSYNRLLCPICLGNDIKLTSFPNDAPHDPDLCTRSPPGISDSANDCDNEDGSPWLYCPPGIWAFSLRHKSWQQVLPQDLSAVPDREKAFERLWMDSGLRHDLGIMVAAYKNHKLNNVNPDIIDGKGHSLNILLRGGPGTGKGMTVGKSYVFPSFASCARVYLLEVPFLASNITIRNPFREARLPTLHNYRWRTRSRARTI